jgi:hypothetical protein
MLIETDMAEICWVLYGWATTRLRENLVYLHKGSGIAIQLL